MITIALSKGRIFTETSAVLAQAGIVPLEDPETSRKFIIPTSRQDVRLLVVRATDVPTYVHYGSADLGVAGYDVLQEQENLAIYPLMNLGIARCSMVIATRDTLDYQAMVGSGARLKVATKYTNTARAYFADKGMHIDLIKLYGSMELAPLVGLADAIVDLVSTGNTLRANHLKVVETISEISAHLIVNQALFKLNRSRLQPLMTAFERGIRDERITA